MPRFSIVMAAYRRPAVMAYAIRSVLDQSETDWELLVIGDACPDRSGEVALGFGDPRIRFHNLPVNCGDQSGPNSEGMAMARGEFIAFLNQDDLWMRDHLATCREALEAGGADLVFSLALRSPVPGIRWITSAPASCRYEPIGFQPASTWLFRRELAARVGPWRHHSRCLAAPSQDWLFRAWRKGARLHCLPWATAVLPNSGSRRGSYLGYDDSEHRDLYRRMREEPDFMRREAISSARAAEEYGASQANTRERHLRRPGVLATVASRLVAMAGIHPHAALNFLRFGGPGNFVRALRRYRGLDAPIRSRGDTVVEPKISR